MRNPRERRRGRNPYLRAGRDEFCVGLAEAWERLREEMSGVVRLDARWGSGCPHLLARGTQNDDGTLKIVGLPEEPDDEPRPNSPDDLGYGR